MSTGIISHRLNLVSWSSTQCTTKYCRDGQGETDLWTTMLHLQESFDNVQKHVTKQNEIIRSLQQHLTEQDELVRSLKEELSGKYWAILTRCGRF